MRHIYLYTAGDYQSFTFVLPATCSAMAFQPGCHHPRCQLTELLKQISSYLESAHQLPAFSISSITGYNWGICSKLGTSWTAPPIIAIHPTSIFRRFFHSRNSPQILLTYSIQHGPILVDSVLHSLSLNINRHIGSPSFVTAESVANARGIWG